MLFRSQETQEKEKTYKHKPKIIKKMVIGTYISIITLNINRLNAPIKRHRAAGWIKKQDPTKCSLQETQLSSKYKHRLQVKGWKMILQENSSQKKVDIAIFI